MAFPPTDWGDFTPEEYAVRAPATSWSFERWFRNVVAMAQGAIGAPRVMPKALHSNLIGAVVAGPGGAGGVTGIGGIKSIRGISTWQNAGGTSANFAISFSTDGGASWGANQTFLNPGATIDTGILFFELDMNTGAIVSGGVGYGSAASSVIVPAGADAIRWVRTGGSPIVMNMMITAEGGMDDV